LQQGILSTIGDTDVTGDSEKSRNGSVGDQDHLNPQEKTMKMRLLGALVALAISFALPTFGQQKETVDPKILEQLDALGKKLDEAFNNNDAAAVAALFTEDAIWVVDTGPLYGRQAIEKQVAEWFKGARSSNHIDRIDPSSPRIVGTAEK
jgi:hypothetical protein